jgi:excisionase family DNA binding protein
MEEGLLDVDTVAEHLGVGPVTVWRWCREGVLPCAKIGRKWRIRRSAVDEFVRRSEHSATLVGRLRSFLEVPDNVLAVAQNRKLLHRLDAAFFRAGEARGGALVKYVGGEPETPPDELRADLEREGLGVARLEEEDRFQLSLEPDPRDGRVGELRRLLDEMDDGGRSVWVSFDWSEQISLDEALKQQGQLAEIVEASQLVIKTALLEGVLDEWSGAMQRRAQVMHSGTIWLSEAGLLLSRVVPPPTP